MYDNQVNWQEIYRLAASGFVRGRIPCHDEETSNGWYFSIRALNLFLEYISVTFCISFKMEYRWSFGVNDTEGKLNILLWIPVIYSRK